MSMMPPMIPGASAQRTDVPSSPNERAFDRFNAAAEDKQRKQDVAYRKGSGEGRCSECEYWDGNEGCAKVAGRIAPDGVCDLFEKAEPEKMPSPLGETPSDEGDADDRPPPR